MMLPRRGAASAQAKAEALKERSQRKKPTLDEFVNKMDWSGGLGLLQFERNTQESIGAENSDMTIMWMAYCAFHLGDYKKSVRFLDELINQPQAEPVWNLYKACCLFYLGQYKEAYDTTLKTGSGLTGPAGRLQNRLLFHLAHKLNDEVPPPAESWRPGCLRPCTALSAPLALPAGSGSELSLKQVSVTHRRVLASMRDASCPACKR